MLPSGLVDGYRLWREARLPQERGRLAQLAALGQAPQAFIIACCDSRMSPETVFSSGPGELFVMRNVANVVPPYQPDGRHHGTSAAIEFALLGLAVPHIVVMGHSHCGGVKAYLQSSFDENAGSRGDFIGHWMDLIEGAKEDALAREPGLLGRALELATEEAAIRLSIRHLRTFPEVSRREAEGTLTVHGAHLDIANGQLTVLDEETGAFAPVLGSQLIA
ncbi:carbonic anhydrase [Terrihabitans rhizophilus]|jgi:carbonic anhydrase|uniref:Carbonic anhydrase n=1 Tax=Terrihabitans rhizophilus TaxID=3092662 RepID=A0ABU4RMQ1_9HYPH|nr:carbonic anhydrase [Terrihabitans sp. PJ23]MDX6806099.1 carbonic anhydrase [Terrihabitans sp. PJ23]